MKSKTLRVAPVTAILLLMSLGAQATIIEVTTVDFDDPGVLTGDADYSFGGYSITSRGCDFTTAGFGGIENDVDGSKNGTTNMFARDATMTCGGAFDLLTFDLGEDYQADSFKFFVDLLFADGGSLTGSAFTYGVFGFETWAFTSGVSTNLVSIRWYTNSFDSNESAYQFSLDNVRINFVPEPGTLALLGIGLLGIGVTSRRRKI